MTGPDYAKIDGLLNPEFTVEVEALDVQVGDKLIDEDTDEVIQVTELDYRTHSDWDESNPRSYPWDCDVTIEVVDNPSDDYHVSENTYILHTGEFYKVERTP